MSLSLAPRRRRLPGREAGDRDCVADLDAVAAALEELEEKTAGR
jgi:hypothetical protein